MTTLFDLDAIDRFYRSTGAPTMSDRPNPDEPPQPEPQPDPPPPPPPEDPIPPRREAGHTVCQT